MTEVLTVGHGAGEIGGLLDRLVGAGVRRLVDVRSSPSSRKHPQFGRDNLAASLEDAGIAYEWRPAFGGWRRARPGSRHTALRSQGFRGYADHMESAEFREALGRLIETSDRVPTAVMCAESLWWRCHRSLLADALVAAGCRVRHILPDGELRDHELRRAARVEDGVVVYDRPDEP